MKVVLTLTYSWGGDCQRMSYAVYDSDGSQLVSDSFAGGAVARRDVPTNLDRLWRSAEDLCSDIATGAPDEY